MANFAITISNSIRTWAPAPGMRWGVDAWGTLWGVGTSDIITNTKKVISNAIGSDTAITLTSTFFKTLANVFAFSEDLSSETITDGSGYFRFYPGGSTNLEDRVISTYSTAAAGTITYSSSTAGNTVWS